jgi:cytosine deaminase
MCSGTIIFYKMPTVIIGENVTLVGEEELLKSKGVDVKILNDKRCIQLMSQFIRQDPKLWDEDSGA